MFYFNAQLVHQCAVHLWFFNKRIFIIIKSLSSCACSLPFSYFSPSFSHSLPSQLISILLFLLHPLIFLPLFFLPLILPSPIHLPPCTYFLLFILLSLFLLILFLLSSCSPPHIPRPPTLSPLLHDWPISPLPLILPTHTSSPALSPLVHDSSIQFLLFLLLSLFLLYLFLLLFLRPSLPPIAQACSELPSPSSSS